MVTSGRLHLSPALVGFTTPTVLTLLFQDSEVLSCLRGGSCLSPFPPANWGGGSLIPATYSALDLRTRPAGPGHRREFLNPAFTHCLIQQYYTGSACAAGHPNSLSRVPSLAFHSGTSSLSGFPLLYLRMTGRNSYCSPEAQSCLLDPQAHSDRFDHYFPDRQVFRCPGPPQCPASALLAESSLTGP